MLDDDKLTPDETAARIRAAIKDCERSKVEIADLLDVTPQAITGWETTGRIAKPNLSALALLVGKPIEHFINRRPTKSGDDGFADVRGYASGIDMGDGAAAEEYSETHKLKFRKSSLRNKGLLDHSLEIYYGRGDSMEPHIRDGAALLVDRSDTEPRDDAIFILESDDGAIAKRLRDLGGRWFVDSDNRSDPKWRKPVPMDGKRHFTIVGRVRWIASWED